MFAYAEKVPEVELSKFVDSVREDKAISSGGLQDFKIFPEKDKDEYLPIKYVAPLTEETRGVIGFDVAESQIPAQDLLDARDKDLITSTEDFKMDLLDKNVIMVFKAIYKKDTPHGTIEERRAALKGYVVIVFETQELLDYVFSSAEGAYVGVSLYKSGSATSSPPIYDSRQFEGQTTGYRPRFVDYHPYLIANRTWIIGFHSTPYFDAYMDVRMGPKLILYGGSLISLLIAAAIYLLLDARTRAAKIASRMTADLRASEEKFSATFHSSPNLISITRLSDGTILDVNEGYTQTLGYTREESIGKTTLMLSLWVDPADRSTFAESLRKFGQVADFETKLRRKDGAVRSVINSARVIELEGEKCILSVIHDITDRKALEEELLRASENRYRTIFLSSRDAIMTLEPPNWNFTSGNPATLEMFKAKDEAEFLSYEPWRLSPELQPDGTPSILGAKEMIQKAMREGRSFFEWTHKRLDGENFPAEVLLSRVDYGNKQFLHSLVRDITERKIVEEQLKAYSEERFKVVFDNASDGMVLTDLQTKRFYDNNAAFSKMLGYSAKEIKNLGISDIHPKEALPYVLDQFEKQARKEISTARDLPAKRKDGSVFYVDINSSPVTIEGKKFILGIFRDITERREADAALQERTEQLQKLNRALLTISEANQVAIQAVNEDKLLRDVCNILVKNAGYKMVWVGYAENDENRSIRPVAWAGHADGYIEKLKLSWAADTARGRGPTGTAIREKRIVVDSDFSKDPDFEPWLSAAKSLGYVGSAAIPLFSDGHVFGALNIYSAEADLFNSAEMKMLEELAGDLAFSVVSIRTREEKEKVFEELQKTATELQQFKRAVDNASDHIIITDPDAKIIYANRGAERTTGYPVKEMIGKTPALWGKQMPKEFYERMWHTIKIEKKSFVGKVNNRRKNGENYLAEFSITPILNDKEDIIFFVGVERDITQAEEIDRSKSEFVSLASHQLRTPLSAINWYAEMLLGGDAGALNDKQKDYTSEIYASSRRMAELVGALLNVSRIELGTFAIEPKPTDIRDIANSVIGELKPKISSKNQTIVHTYSEDMPEFINIDPNLTRMILQNLISNSVKYTPDGGKISISISKTEKNIVVKVADNGYGIPLNQQGRLFQKFFRGDNIIPVETDGTGLGLYIVKEVVEKAGGAISFESEENVGTTFTVSIPISGMKQKPGTRSLDGGIK